MKPPRVIRLSDVQQCALALLKQGPVKSGTGVMLTTINSLISFGLASAKETRTRLGAINGWTAKVTAAGRKWEP